MSFFRLISKVLCHTRSAWMWRSNDVMLKFCGDFSPTYRHLWRSEDTMSPIEWSDMYMSMLDFSW